MRQFFRRWHPRLIRFFFARLGDADLAEDLTQEAFLRLIRSRPRDPDRWLPVVAGNLVRDEIRLTTGRARHLRLIHASLRDERDPGPEPELLRREAIVRVRTALQGLAARDRDLLVLHHTGFRYREIAERVGLAPSSIGPLLTRAQRRFVECYDALEDDGRAVVLRNASG